MRRRRRPVTPDSLRSAITAIGSVAPISTPKTRADSSGQPSQAASPPATTSAHSTTPMVDSRTTGTRSRSQIAPAEVQRRLEQERRQHDVEDQVVGQREAGLAAGQGERGARQHEADRIGQAETPRRQRDQNREAKKRERPEQEDVHAACLPVASRKRNRLARAIPTPRDRRRRADSARDRPVRRRRGLHSGGGARSSGRSNRSCPGPRPRRHPGPSSTRALDICA